MQTLGVGIIGYGFMGKTHGYAVRSLPLFYEHLPFRAQVRGVCSHTEASVALGQAALDAPFGTTDYRALLARPDIDVVSVCTPNVLHEEMMLAALAAGKHVYIDKPLTTSLESARRIVRAADAAGVKSQLVFHNRFFPSLLRARQLVMEGRIGQVLSVRADYLHSGSVDPQRPAGWKQDATVCGGGVLFDLGSHALDLIVWLAGDIEAVHAATRVAYPAREKRGGGMITSLGDDHALLTLRMAGGALGSVEVSKIATGAGDELTVAVYGTRGALRWDVRDADTLHFFDEAAPEAPLGGMRGWQAIDSGQRYAPPGGVFLPAKNRIGWARAHVHCLYSFLNAVITDTVPTPSVRDGAYVQAVMEAAYRAAETGTWQPVAAREALLPCEP